MKQNKSVRHKKASEVCIFNARKKLRNKYGAKEQ
jgi:hypothetical protein